MSVLIYAESSEGAFKKAAFEVTAYGKKLAEQLGTSLVALAINANDATELYKYGAEKVLTISNSDFKETQTKVVANIINQAATKEGASTIVLAGTSFGLAISPIIAIKADAGYASNVVALPSSTAPFTISRKVFTNKAFANTTISTENKVISLAKNSFGLQEAPVDGTSEEFSPEASVDCPMISVGVEKAAGKVTIADADTVVSGGRGLKGPENWNLIEDLAAVLGGATACSKPVSDLGWRPHAEHVGQTGKPVSSNLYIAIGISGAIQHLAGVNASKVKVVINTDPEAPFFKAAEYGIVGDAFEVVPELIEKLKNR